jgi:hypothetical protein
MMRLGVFLVVSFVVLWQPYLAPAPTDIRDIINVAARALK